MKKVFMRAAAIFLCIFCTAETMAADYTAVDGDSLVSDGRRIRLDGIDAPEFMQTCTDAEGKKYACGQASLAFLKKLMNGKNITCDCLPQKDRYNREICECFANGVSLNKAMVSAGQATAYRDEKYAASEAAAENKKLGIWQGKHMRPAIYRALHRSEAKR